MAGVDERAKDSVGGFLAHLESEKGMRLVGYQIVDGKKKYVFAKVKTLDEDLAKQIIQ